MILSFFFHWQLKALIFLNYSHCQWKWYFHSSVLFFDNWSPLLSSAEESLQNPHENEQNTPENDIPELNPQILSILGDDTPQIKTSGPPIQKDLALRWSNILKSGLKEEEKERLIGKYPPNENCLLLAAPNLNLEVVPALAESTVERDSRLLGLQNQIGAALAS